MSGRYLTDLAGVCRAAGLDVIEVNGWQTRARSSGGYGTGRPTTVMVHHTASGASADGWGDVNYICYGSPDKPLSNLYLDRHGSVWVCAAGCTNTNGKGSDTWGGGVPNDSMNSYAIGIEAGNNGVGEKWPWEQQISYLALCRALCDHYGISYNNVRGHFEWAPTRKVDPAGPSAWAAGSASWNMTHFRSDVKDYLPPEPTPSPPTQEDDDMVPFLIRNNETGGVALVYGEGKVTGLDGDSLPAFIQRYGNFIDMPPVTYNDFAAKGG